MVWTLSIYWYSRYWAYYHGLTASPPQTPSDYIHECQKSSNRLYFRLSYVITNLFLFVRSRACKRYSNVMVIYTTKAKYKSLSWVGSETAEGFSTTFVDTK